jgi:hypothetical protein
MAEFDRRGPQRGDAWLCPYCGATFPLADVGDRLVPVQAVLAEVFVPLARVLNAHGQPTTSNAVELLERSQCRPIHAFVPHSHVCQIGSLQARGIPAPLFCVLEPSPPPCSCGHPWHVHQPRQISGADPRARGACAVDGCDCEEYQAPPVAEEGETNG